jgi:hypothetical protein
MLREITFHYPTAFAMRCCAPRFARSFTVT